MIEHLGVNRSFLMKVYCGELGIGRTHCVRAVDAL